MAKPRRYMYSLHHQNVGRGYLNTIRPFLILDTVPGDTMFGNMSLLIRLSSMKKPLMHDLFIDSYLFYVPYRLVWSDWEDFMAEGPSSWVATPKSPPTVTARHDGLWMDETNSQSKSAFPWYAYNLIYNEYFRDNEFPVQAPTAKESAGNNCWFAHPKPHMTNLLREQIEVENPVTVDTSGPTLAAEDILRAIAEQKDKMKRATYGTRYVDILRSYGVNVTYNMLQRPELVASSHGTLNITDVVATDAANLGDIAGYAIGGRRIRLRRKTFPEHGVLMGVCVVRPPYIDRHIKDFMYKGDLKYEHFFDPGLTRLPPETISQKDITWEETTDTDLGYTPWYEWYRHAHNKVEAAVSDYAAEHLQAASRTSIALDSLRGGTLTDVEWLNETADGHYQFGAKNALKALRLIPPKSGVFGTEDGL